MNPTLSNTVAGDPATKLRRFATVTIVVATANIVLAAANIVQPLEVAKRQRELTDPRRLHARCRLFHRNGLLNRCRVLVTRDHGEVRSDKDLECLSEKLLNHRSNYGSKLAARFSCKLPFLML
jgi:hypothetical protein